MKKHASVVCLMALAWHMSVRPSLAQDTEPLRADQRPIHAAIAAAGDHYGHLLSQTGGNRRISGRQRRIIALASAVGFGVGYGVYYFKNRPLDFADDRGHAIASGTFSAIIAGAITWEVLAGP